MFSTERTNDSARIYVLKRELAEMRRAVMPLREPMNRFTAGAVHGIHSDAGPYFRDVADHLNRVAETIDSLDSLLSTAFEAHIAQISIQQNDDMRRISAAAGLIVAPTVVGSIYGMNFDHMPELHWACGYPMALALDGAQLTGRLHHQQARRLAVSQVAGSGADHAGRQAGRAQRSRPAPAGRARTSMIEWSATNFSSQAIGGVGRPRS